MDKENEVYKENYVLKKRIEEMESDFSDITTIIYCVGGPLNDNAYGYTVKQLGPFGRIAKIAGNYQHTGER